MVEKFDILKIDNEKRRSAQDTDYEQYEMTVNFTDNSDKPIKFVMLSSERLSKFFETVKLILPNREKGFYCKISFQDLEGTTHVLDETNADDCEGFFGGALCEHECYQKAKMKNEDEKIIPMEVTGTFLSMKSINIQIFTVKITDENKYRAKNYFDNYIAENSLRFLTYNITYNMSYFTITKDVNDVLVIITDENFIEDVMKNDFDKADKILFWTDTEKAKGIMKKFPKKIMACNKKFDFLLTPRYFTFN